MRFKQFYISEEDARDRVESLITSHECIFFFKNHDDIFGASEDGRIAFAHLKDPGDELPDGWSDEATFVANNLTKGLSGECQQSVFTKSDLKKIKVIDEDDAIKELTKLAKTTKPGTSDIGSRITLILNKAVSSGM